MNINNKQLCADVLINRIHYKRALGQGPSPCEVQLALSLVEECLYIKSQPIDALLISIALEVSTAYYFKSHREEASAQRKKATITRFLVKNHWQLALQVCNTKASQAFLFLELQKVSLSVSPSAYLFACLSFSQCAVFWLKNCYLGSVSLLIRCISHRRLVHIAYHP